MVLNQKSGGPEGLTPKRVQVFQFKRLKNEKVTSTQRTQWILYANHLCDCLASQNV